MVQSAPTGTILYCFSLSHIHCTKLWAILVFPEPDSPLSITKGFVHIDAIKRFISNSENLRPASLVFELNSLTILPSLIVLNLANSDISLNSSKVNSSTLPLDGILISSPPLMLFICMDALIFTSSNFIISSQPGLVCDSAIFLNLNSPLVIGSLLLYTALVTLNKAKTLDVGDVW